jgi:probable HAF family extracellular repeat protein
LTLVVSAPAMAQLGSFVLASPEQLAEACGLNPNEVQKIEVTESGLGVHSSMRRMSGKIHLQSGTVAFSVYFLFGDIGFADCWTSPTQPNRSGGATDTSPNPHVVGYLDNGGTTPYHAFRYDIQTTDLLDLGTLDPLNATAQSFANGVSSDGSVVVGYSSTSSGFDHAFRWTEADDMADLEAGTATTASRATDISGDGTKIVGWRGANAFLCTYASGICTFQDLTSGIATTVTADGSAVAGKSGNTAFRWSSADGVQNLGALSGHSHSAALDISDNGKIVVGLSSLFLIDFFGVAGAERYDQSNSRAFRWTAATGTQDFRQLLINAGVGMTGITLVAITGVSPDGQWIVGEAKTPSTGTNETVLFLAQYCDAGIDGACRRAVNNDLLVDFGSPGLWLFQNNTLFRKIHNASPIAVASGNLDGGTGQTEAIASFPGSGLYARFNNANTWTRINSSVPARVGAGDFNGDGIDEVVADFGSSGLWRRAANGAWTRLLNTTTQGLAVGDLDGNGKAELIADRGATGLWARYNDANWVRLNASNPVRVIAGDLDGDGKDEAIADFSSGVWARFNNATWSKLTPIVSQGLASGDFNGDGRDDLLADRGSTGLWVRYGNNPTWSKLLADSPANLAIADLDSNGKAEAIVDRGPSGLWARYNNTTWKKLNTKTSQAIVEGRFD